MRFPLDYNMLSSCQAFEQELGCSGEPYCDKDQEPVSRKSMKLFGRISGDIIPFVSLERKRLEARNITVTFSA